MWPLIAPVARSTISKQSLETRFIHSHATLIDAGWQAPVVGGTRKQVGFTTHGGCKTARKPENPVCNTRPARRLTLHQKDRAALGRIEIGPARSNRRSRWRARRSFDTVRQSRSFDWQLRVSCLSITEWLISVKPQA